MVENKKKQQIRFASKLKYWREVLDSINNPNADMLQTMQVRTYSHLICSVVFDYEASWPSLRLS